MSRSLANQTTSFAALYVLHHQHHQMYCITACWCCNTSSGCAVEEVVWVTRLYVAVAGECGTHYIVIVNAHTLTPPPAPNIMVAEVQYRTRIRSLVPRPHFLNGRKGSGEF